MLGCLNPINPKNAKNSKAFRVRVLDFGFSCHQRWAGVTAYVGCRV